MGGQWAGRVHAAGRSTAAKWRARTHGGAGSGLGAWAGGWVAGGMPRPPGAPLMVVLQRMHTSTQEIEDAMPHRIYGCLTD